MSLRFYNTLTKKKERFEPLERGVVRMYNCGPTVYDYAHIGNFRSYVFADVLRRYLEYKGFEVKQVMNITDVGHLTQDDIEAGEDKIQKAAKERKTTPYDISDFYTKAFIEDSKTLNLKEPMVRPKATEHVQEMIETIQKLIEKGHAYVSNGSVYYDVSSFPDYGKLSGNTLEKLKAGAGGRVEHNPDKKSQFDFALWVKDPEHLMKWTSPWSVGYPGWHIECSSMSKKYLGETLDIHTGGEDNIFPHHEAEIAQAEGATGKEFVRYWMHARHLLVDGKKMSKSLGNFYTLRDLLKKGFSPRAIRYVLMNGHYRQQMNFTLESIENAEKTIQRMLEFKSKLEEEANGNFNEKLSGKVSATIEKFEEFMDDDLNTAPAIAEIHELINSANKSIAEGDINQENLEEIKKAMERFDQVLGILQDGSIEVPAEVKELAETRRQAREAKDFKKSDELRDKIKELGWEVQDTPEGQKLRKQI